MSNLWSAFLKAQSRTVPRRTLALGPARVRIDPAIWLPWLVGGVLMIGLLGVVLVLGGGGRENTLTHPDSVTSVAFSPDGALLASGAADSVVRLWDPARGLPVRELTGHGAAVQSVAFAPDSKLLASGSTDRTIRLWDPATGTPIRTIPTNLSVDGVAFSPDGTLIAGIISETVGLWDPG